MQVVQDHCTEATVADGPLAGPLAGPPALEGAEASLAAPLLETLGEAPPMGTAGNVGRDGPGVLALPTPELGPDAGTGTGLGTATAGAGAGAAGPRAGAGAGTAGVGARGADTGATDAAEGAGLPEAGLAWLADVVDMS